MLHLRPVCIIVLQLPPQLHTQDNVPELGLLDIWEGLEGLMADTEESGDEDLLGATWERNAEY